MTKKRPSPRPKLPTYRLYLRPITIGHQNAKSALDLTRRLRDRINKTLREIGFTEDVSVRVERRGPRGGWHRVREGVGREP